MNPAVTLSFLRLGKIAPADAAGYVAAQFVGGSLGIAGADVLLGGLPAHPAINHVATLPGPAGSGVAFAAEAVISFALMAVVLSFSNRTTLARFTGAAAGCLVALAIVVEAPMSGMSMNPARSLASAVFAGEWTSFWIYVIAPPLGMLAAAECYVRLRGAQRVFCAKLRHDTAHRCIFRCAFGALGEV